MRYVRHTSEAYGNVQITRISLHYRRETQLCFAMRRLSDIIMLVKWVLALLVDTCSIETPFIHKHIGPCNGEKISHARALIANKPTLKRRTPYEQCVPSAAATSSSDIMI